MFRYDFFSIENLRNAQKTDQGFLKAPMYATRVGVFKYIMPDGSIRRELRHPREVFNKDSLETLKNVPITVRHPKEMVSSKTATKLTVGTVGEVIQEVADKYVQVNAVIYDENSIRKVLSGYSGNDGLGEVSAGYHADIVEKSGSYNGEEYDVEQTNIRYNHVALVDRGRMGPEVKLRLDSQSAIRFDEQINQIILDQINDKHKGDNTMEKIKIGDQTFEVKPELKKAFDTMMKGHRDEMEMMKKKSDKKMDGLDVAIGDMKDQRDKAEAKADTLEIEVTELKNKLTEAEAKTDSAAINKMIKERKEVEVVAEKVFAEEIKKGEMKLDSFESALEIKKAIVKKVSPDLSEDKLESDVYVGARFDAIAEQPEDDKSDDLAETVKDAQDKKEEKKDQKAELPEWQQPLTASK